MTTHTPLMKSLIAGLYNEMKKDLRVKGGFIFIDRQGRYAKLPNPNFGQFVDKFFPIIIEGD